MLSHIAPPLPTLLSGVKEAETAGRISVILLAAGYQTVYQYSYFPHGPIDIDVYCVSELDVFSPLYLFGCTEFITKNEKNNLEKIKGSI